MTQAQRDLTAGAEDNLRRAGIPAPPVARPFSGWLALGEPNGPIDLTRLFPEVEIRLESDSTEFARALAEVEPSLVVLIAPPAGVGDLQRVAAWLVPHRRSPAVLLSAHKAVAVRLHALELGLDDAIDMSSDPAELVGRLSIAGRRVPDSSRAPGNRIVVGPGVELDLRARAIRRDGRLLSLRPRELALLEFLALHPGQAFARGDLLKNVWPGIPGNERTVDVYVFWLRAKIERDPASPVHLLTVRGSGYLFEPPAAPGDGRSQR
jgi:DNA-binding response OmpR family regulator